VATWWHNLEPDKSVRERTEPTTANTRDKESRVASAILDNRH